ncbi:MAG: hypothetical protein RPT25_16075 [Cycloclasticus sp.]|jgi:hypothetical protein
MTTTADTKSTAKKATYKKQTQNEFEGRAMAAMPRWAWAFCAILMALSLAIRQMGLDISSPLNRLMTAYAVSIEKDAARGGMSAQGMNECKDLIEDYGKRVEKLEKWTHKPNGSAVDD